MLKGHSAHPLNPDLLQVLRAMGHGDEIAIVDANFPADSAGPPVMRLDGLSTNDLLDAILTVLPLDTFVEEQAWGMAVVGDPDKREQTHLDFDALIKKHEVGMSLSLLERFAFYERVREGVCRRPDRRTPPLRQYPPQEGHHPSVLEPSEPIFARPRNERSAQSRPRFPGRSCR